MKTMLPWLAVVAAVACTDVGTLPADHVLQPLNGSEAGATDTAVPRAEAVVDDFVLTELDAGSPEARWWVEAGPYQWVTFRLRSPEHLDWEVVAPDGLVLDIYQDAGDEVTHGKTGEEGGTFEVSVALPDAVDEAHIELLIEREML